MKRRGKTGPDRPVPAGLGLFLLLGLAISALAAGGPVPLTPGRVALAPGEIVRFSIDEEGIGARWEVIPRSLGDVDGAGLFHAGEREGRGIVRVVVGEGSGRRVGHALVTVRSEGPREGQEIRIRPRTARVLPGESVRFRAGEIEPETPLLWTVRPEGIGTITPDGVFTANEVFADAGSRQLTRREGIVIVRAETARGVIHGRARILIGGGELPGELLIEPGGVAREVGPGDVLSGKGLPFRARFVGPSFDTSPIVEWRVEPPGFLRVEPRVGNRTVLRWDGNVTDLAAAFPYRGRVIAEWTGPNGGKFGASAPVSIRLENVDLDLTATPPRIDLRGGESVSLSFRASLPVGPEVAADRLLFFGTVVPPRLGVFHNGSRVFVAGEEGEGALVIVARGVDLPLQGEVVVPVRVRAKGDATGPGSGR